MTLTQSTLVPPPLRNSNLAGPIEKNFLTLQTAHPLITVDTSAGTFSDSPPPAGLNQATGQSNQNMEIIYTKSSSDGNAFTLTGVEGGPYMLHAQYDVIRIKSDGTNWWPVG